MKKKEKFLLNFILARSVVIVISITTVCAIITDSEIFYRVQRQNNGGHTQQISQNVKLSQVAYWRLGYRRTVTETKLAITRTDQIQCRAVLILQHHWAYRD